MDSLPLLIIVIGTGVLTLILGVLLIFFIIRRRTKDKELSRSSLPIYEPSTTKGFIPLNNISSTEQFSPVNNNFSSSPIKPPSLEQKVETPDNLVNTDSASNSFWQGGEGYYVTPPSEKSHIQPPFNIQTNLAIPPQALVSPREQPNPPTPATLVGKENERGDVYLEGLLESKKWKLKDFNVNNETYHRPKKSNVWRTSYSVW